MADQNTNTKVILKKDPDFINLDFNLLRSEGLKHIGDLSGKIWTDHNVHDPGVTILEMLVYALLDLGYRARLPIEDLLAIADPEQQEEDNFFTPAQILTNNPTTILDYRKMLIDIEGVRNAWLEIHDGDKLYVDCNCGEPLRDPTDSGNPDTPGITLAAVLPPTTERPAPELSCCGAGLEAPCDVTLNGLYKVYIELDPRVLDRSKNRKETEKEIIDEVRRRLHGHRNLCEDFAEICVLCQEEISFCADVELKEGAHPEAVYVQIIQTIKQFLSPDLHFYTLQELLDKGKSIEEIFEGRPFTLESHGFMDTEELEAIERPVEIHLSDIYNLIFQVDGVKSIRNLDLVSRVGNADHNTDDQTECSDWVHRLCEDCIPVFQSGSSAFNLFIGTRAIRLDQEEITKLLEASLSEFRKVKTNDPKLLDRPIPLGRYRPDLEDYYSIQNEFPRTYGIGEGGLPDSAPIARKAQALQLKGYLLFFDQLLASYLSQLTHVRDLFSMLPDSRRSADVRHTYFSQRLENVPMIERLVRFYTDDKSDLGWTQESTLARPVAMGLLTAELERLRLDPEGEITYDVHYFDAPFKRDTAASQLRREFLQAEYQIEIFGEKCAHYFVITTSFPEVGLVSKKRYDTIQQAKEAAHSVIFLGTLEENYDQVNLYNDDGTASYSFDITFHPVDYLTFLQVLVENDDLYCRRRDDFLNHLLARFGETFTDFSLLMYEAIAPEKGGKERLLEDKARYLYNYADLSRDRGKAFDYCLNGWNTDNVSGLEKNVAGLAGIQDFQRRNLCNFEVHQYGEEDEILLLGWRKQAQGTAANGCRDNEVILRSTERFDSRTYAASTLEAMLTRLQAGEGLGSEFIEAENIYRLFLRTSKGNALSPETFRTQEAVDHKIKAIQAFYSAGDPDQNVFVSATAFQLDLLDENGQVIRRSRKQYDSAKKALDDQVAFTEKVNNQLKVSGDPPALRLVPGAGPRTYLDLNAMEAHQETGDPLYKWEWREDKKAVLIRSTATFDTERQAAEGFAAAVSAFGEGGSVEKAEEDGQFVFTLQTDGGEELGRGAFKTADRRDAAAGAVEGYFKAEHREGRYLQRVASAYRWEVTDDSEAVLFRGCLLYPHKRMAERAWLVVKNNAGVPQVTTADGLRIEMRNEDGLLIAVSDTFRSRNEADLALTRIENRWQEQQYVRFSKVADVYGYQIPDPANGKDVLLKSYSLFESKGEALLALQKHLRYTTAKKNYFLSGDEANLNYSFQLRDQNGQFIAVHPGSYAEQEEQEAALVRVLNELKKFSFPLQYLRQYIFQLVNDEKKVLLRSGREYDSPEAAREAFDTVIPLALDPDRMSLNPVPGSVTSRLELKEGDTLHAYSPQGVPTDRGGERLIAEVTSLVGGPQYEVAPHEFASRWQYRLFWENPDQIFEELLISNELFTDRDPALRQYRILIENLDSVRVETPPNGPLQFFKERETEAFATYGGSMPADDAAKRRLAAGATDWLECKVAVSVPYRTQPDNYAHLIKSSDESQAGHFSYRVVKKGLPIAFHPCECYHEKEREAIQDHLNCLYSLRNEYVYLEIYLTKNQVCKIDDYYHYQIQEKDGPVYLVSYQGYATEEEALAAFEASYLYLIERASQATGYYQPPASDPDNCIPPAGQGGTEPPIICLGGSYADPTVRFLPKNAPWAVVPPERLSELEEQGIDPVAFLTDKFQSYPIRIIQDVCLDDPCQEGKVFRYYFHLVGTGECHPDGDCEVDWKSYRLYDTVEDATRDFRKFRYILKSKASYRTQFDESGYLDCWGRGEIPDPATIHEQALCNDCDELGKDLPSCCHYLTLNEVLLEGTRRFRRKEYAWGNPTFLAVYRQTFSSLNEACGFQDELRSQLAAAIGEGFNCRQALQQRVDYCGNLLYYFVINPPLGDGTSRALLESFQGYATEEEAIRACENLRAFIASDRYFCIFKAGACDFRLAIDAFDGQLCPVEDDWGRVAAVCREQYKSLGEACQALESFGTDSLQVGTFTTELVQVRDESLLCLLFTVTAGVDATGQEGVSCTFKSTRLFDPDEVPTVSSQIRQWAADPANWQIVNLDDCYYGLAVVQGPRDEEGGDPREVSCEDLLCETKGLEYLLDAGCEEGAFYPYEKDGVEKCYSFFVVDRDFRMARHPFEYHTLEDCRRAIKWLNCFCHSCAEAEMPQLQVAYDEASCSFVAEIRYTLDDNDRALRLPAFPQDKKYRTEREAREAALDFIQYARERSDVCASTAVDWKTPSIASVYFEFEAALRYEGIWEESRWAICQIPIVKNGDRYTFQLYCEAFTQMENPEDPTGNLPVECQGIPKPKVISTDIDDSEQCQNCQEGPDPDAVISPIIWVSNQWFDSYEEARCHFKKFCELLQDQVNYRCTNIFGCGPYSIELTNPEEILAEHPQCYDRISELEEAMDRTRACMNQEGFHLIEHILLRPQKYIDQSNQQNVGAFYPYIPAGFSPEQAQYAYLQVTPAFRLARHPDIYTSPEACEEAVGRLLQNCGDCANRPRIESFLEEDGCSYRTRFIFTVEDGTPQSYVLPKIPGSAFYPSEEDAIAAGMDFIQFVRAIGNLCKVSLLTWDSDWLEEVEIAYNAFTENLSQNQVNQLARAVCLFPYVKDGDVYRFQYYCPAFSPRMWTSRANYDSLFTAFKGYQRFCQLLGNEQNFQCAVDPNDVERYSLELVDPAQIIANYDHPYTDFASVTAAMERNRRCNQLDRYELRSSALVLNLPATTDLPPPKRSFDCSCLLPADPDCDCKLYYDFSEGDPCATGAIIEETECPEDGLQGCKDDCYIPGADPYSFWATVVLPGWTKRFRDHNFREFLQELIRKEAPAHVALNIVWIDPQQMCCFEEEYRRWLRVISKRNVCEPEYELCDFIDCLTGLACHSPKVLVEEQAPSCKKEEAESRLMLNISNVMIRGLFAAAQPAPFNLDAPDLLYAISGNLATVSQLVLPSSNWLQKDFTIQIPPGVAPIGPNLPQFPGAGGPLQPGGPIPPLEPLQPEVRGLEEETVSDRSVAEPVTPEKETGPPEKPAKKSKAKKKTTKKTQATKKAKAKTKKAPPKQPEVAREEPALSRREIAQRIRQRQTRYNQALEAIDNRYFKLTNAYKRSEFFIGETDGNPQAYANLIRFVLADQADRDKPEYKPYYVTVLKNATWYALDKLVLGDPQTVQQAETLRELFKAMKKQGVRLAELRKQWQGEEIKEWIGAKVVDEYQKMIK